MHVNGKMRGLNKYVLIVNYFNIVVVILGKFYLYEIHSWSNCHITIIIPFELDC